MTERQSNRFGDVAIVPDTGRVLIAIRHALRSVIAPQLKDAAALSSLDMIEKMLVQLAGRDPERLAENQAAWSSIRKQYAKNLGVLPARLGRRMPPRRSNPC